MNPCFDALVIGGGPAGSTAAQLLAGSGWKVALVEKAHFPRTKVCGEFLSGTNLPLLRELGVLSELQHLGGPPVRQVGLFAGDTVLRADMPLAGPAGDGWGRALRREILDPLLLERAVATGVQVFQPWSVIEWYEESGLSHCRIVARDKHSTHELRARLIIAAHGSWEAGTLPTQPARRAPRASDLLAFKAHFLQSNLPPGLMPLLVFPGGYGGMVHCGDGRISLSFCIRRDRLDQCRRIHPGCPAAEAGLEFIKTRCIGARDALAAAVLEGSWLAAGPIRPGIRQSRRPGVFLIGNAAGEAHPAIAEGITMALQSAWLLWQRLTSDPAMRTASAALESAQEDYQRAWRASFAGRVRASSVIAHWAMRPAAVALVRPWLGWFPSSLTLAARVSGKSLVLAPARLHT